MNDISSTKPVNNCCVQSQSDKSHRLVNRQTITPTPNNQLQISEKHGISEKHRKTLTSRYHCVLYYRSWTKQGIRKMAGNSLCSLFVATTAVAATAMKSTKQTAVSDASAPHTMQHNLRIWLICTCCGIPVDHRS